MTPTLPTRKANVQGLRERDAVLQQLHEIIASEHFCSSKRYPALLQYVVEHTLAGKTECLKERTIGIEVFHRPPAYDTNSDTVVRFTAGEVRRRLAAYYYEHGHTASVRITLPPGSYVPEFLYEAEPEEMAEDASAVLAPEYGMEALHDGAALDGAGLIEPALPRRELVVPAGAAPETPQSLKWSRRFVFPLAALFVVALGLAWMLWHSHKASAIESFWRPILHDRGTILLCAGGNVFAQSPVPGFFTAGKETEYPYFSLQTAISVTLLSSLIERSGAKPQFEFAASTPLPELHSHPVILLNAYNNQWTLRLVDPLRFHFSPNSEADHSIVDRTRPEVRWARDLSVPYSNADDYALMARFWDTTTENWVLVLAGLGRNGTEAASQFVASAHSMQVLRDQVQGDFATRNMEVVLKTHVIDGKTGPPSIVAVYTW